tara:strand:- start:559 stop:690 length:132 start_codon:yes stop_codon:yes gene_type:complete
MKELLEVLTEIDNDFYQGVYTVGERHDLIKEINQVLRKKHFIQ